MKVNLIFVWKFLNKIDIVLKINGLNDDGRK